MHESVYKQRKAGKTLEELYDSLFEHLNLVNELKAPGHIVADKDGKGTRVFVASDYSYVSADVGSKNYRLVGDAACTRVDSLIRATSPDLQSGFIDPFFSSGVHLAFVGALSAAVSVISVIEGRTVEEEAAKFHSTELMTAYTRQVIHLWYHSVWMSLTCHQVLPRCSSRLQADAR